MGQSLLNHLLLGYAFGCSLLDVLIDLQMLSLKHYRYMGISMFVYVEKSFVHEDSTEKILMQKQKQK